jgi:hypothetical protein
MSGVSARSVGDGCQVIRLSGYQVIKLEKAARVDGPDLITSVAGTHHVSRRLANKRD